MSHTRREAPISKPIGTPADTAMAKEKEDRYDKAKDMADDFVAQYKRGEIGRLGIVYTRFYSPAHQQTQTLSILPVTVERVFTTRCGRNRWSESPQKELL